MHNLIRFISVVVQEMVDSAKAGVMFTVNPVNKHKNEIIIEGSYGLGESVVSGLVTPDSFIVTKKPLRIKEKIINEKTIAIVRGVSGGNKKVRLPVRVAKKACVSDGEVLELARIGMGIEKYYGRPMDIEWAIDKKGKIYILQSRPITTL
ncbi:PEP/pyruvate-binding domain-containing protein [Candidatus Woesearchaeota archaeon]|nr:PEP/pyruvate-binding domain-containing protein [Candidatus Woesearchaeota archaeon]